jgi:hypothetical protein
MLKAGSYYTKIRWMLVFGPMAVWEFGKLEAVMPVLLRGRGGNKPKRKK